MRRVLLALLVVLAGCSFAIDQDRDPVPLTDERCLTDTVPDPADLDRVGNMTARQYPQMPTEENATTIESFAVDFEKAYFANQWLSQGQDLSQSATQNPNFDEFRVLVTNSTVERHPDHYNITIRATFGTRQSWGHLDSNYVINETTIRRKSLHLRDWWPNGVLASCK